MKRIIGNEYRVLIDRDELAPNIVPVRLYLNPTSEWL